MKYRLTLPFVWMLISLFSATAISNESESANCRIENRDWQIDVESALTAARENDKDLFLLFTGSDWCPPCQKLEEEVLSQEDFLKEAANQFVLVLLDFPREKQLPDQVQKQNAEWAQKFGVNSYPTIVLMDRDQRPFAITGYQEGGVEAFLGLIAEKSQKRIRRDEFLQQAKQAKGSDRAKLLDQALSEMDEDIANLYYEELVKEIVEIDTDDQLGLRTKWNAEADAEMRKIIMTDIVTISRLEKPAKAIQFIDEVLDAIKFTAAQRLQVYQVKLDLYRKLENLAAMDAVLDEMIAMDELEGDSRERLIVKKAYLLAGTNRKMQAMQLLDQALADGQGLLYLNLAKGLLQDAGGDYPAAVKSFDKAILQARGNPDVFVELAGAKADSLVAQGNQLAAIQTLDNFADDAAMPADLRGEALLHKAMIMRENRRTRQARLAENRAIEIAESPEQRAEMQKLVDRLRRKYDR